MHVHDDVLEIMCKSHCITILSTIGNSRQKCEIPALLQSSTICIVYLVTS